MRESGASRLSVLMVLLGVAVAAAAFNELRPEPAVEARVALMPAPEQLRTRLEPLPQKPAAPEPAQAPAPTPEPAIEPTPTAERVAAPRPTVQPASSPEPTQRPARPTTYSYDWFEGAAGMERGLKEAKEDGRAIAVYFYTSWCGYCRQLERELLERAEVEGYLKYMTKIRINPESGEIERAIADHYAVTGYPAFFVHRGVGVAPTKISRMTRDNGQMRLKTPQEFVATVQRALADEG